jgi:hypothetical protein
MTLGTRLRHVALPALLATLPLLAHDTAAAEGAPIVARRPADPPSGLVAAARRGSVTPRAPRSPGTVPGTTSRNTPQLDVAPRGLPVTLPTSPGSVWFQVRYAGAPSRFKLRVSCATLCNATGLPDSITAGGDAPTVIPIQVSAPPGTTGQVRVTLVGPDSADGWVGVTVANAVGATYTPGVTPSQPSATVTPNATTQQAFVIQNRGSAPTAYQLAATCVWNGVTVPCTPTPTTTSVLSNPWQGGQPATVTVAVPVGAAGQGQVTLVARAVADGQSTATATASLSAH